MNKKLNEIFDKVFIPFRGNSKDRYIKLFSLVLVPIILWTFLPDNTFPPLTEILASIPKMIGSNDLIKNFIISLLFCIKCICFSTIIAFLIMLLVKIPIFQSFCEFLRKFRFLPSVGLSFLFMKLTHSIEEQMTWIMVFGVSTFMIDSAVSIALSINKDEQDYAKSLRLSTWQIFKELVIYSRMSKFLSAVTQNFAMAWMLLAAVENICKAAGGIGVVLAESNKYFRLEQVYAIQIIILFTGISIDFFLNRVNGWLFPYTKIKQL